MTSRQRVYVTMLALSVLASPAFSACDTVDAYVQGGVSGTEYYSAAIARCYWQGLYTSAFISVDHQVDVEDSGGLRTVYFNSGSGVTYEYTDSTNWLGTMLTRECFYTTGTFFISEPDTYYPVYYDGSSSVCQCLTPLIIALGNRYLLTNVDAGVLFDLDGDGDLDRVAWTEQATDQAFLAFDRNGNGRIDNGTELFGDSSPLPNGQRASNGFMALATFDSNGDGVVDASDHRWAELLLWIDENHNGLSEASELRTVAAAGILELGLQHVWTGRRDQYGNLFKYRAFYRIRGVLRPYYDVWLQIKP